MKNISEMSSEEIQKEIQDYIDTQFDKDENYVFISYSHLDGETIFPVILSWMRQGYNIYLDKDFKNQSSENNWVTTMKDRIRSNNCQLVVCFYSENYCFSYPAMIELLTMRSEETIKNRKSAVNQVVPIDIVKLENEPKNSGKEFSCDDVKQLYKKTYFPHMKAKAGEELWNKNPEEERVCREGLMTLHKKNEVEVDEQISRLKYSYGQGIGNFYPEVASVIDFWKKENNLNGNDKVFKEYDTKRFKDLKIYFNDISLDSYQKTEEPEANDRNMSVAVGNNGYLSEEADANTSDSKDNKAGRAGTKENYSVFNKKGCGNQSQMMVDTIKAIVEKNPDKLEDLAFSLICVETKPMKELRNVSYFNVGQECQVDGTTYSIGTAFGREAKLAQIRKAIMLAQEDPHAFEIEGLYDEKQLKKAEKQYEEGKNEKNENSVKSNDAVGKSGGKESYTIFGKKSSGNQSQMMIDAIKAIIEKNIDMIDVIADELISVAVETMDNLRGISYFRVGESFTYNGVVYSIGTSFGRDAKLAQIRKAIMVTGEDPHAFEIEGLFDDKQLKEAESRYEEKNK